MAMLIYNFQISEPKVPTYRLEPDIAIDRGEQLTESEKVLQSIGNKSIIVFASSTLILLSRPPVKT